MSVISFEELNKLNLEKAGKSIAKYSSDNDKWLHQYDIFFNKTRINTSPVQRMTELLSIVRYNGWNMNRQNQCSKIIKDIYSGKIKDYQLRHFWDLVDNLPPITLCQLSFAGDSVINLLNKSFTNIREILKSWHSSVGSICFLTKVILMFNWGHTPAYDSRIRKILCVKNSISEIELTQSLVEIGSWIHHFERRFCVNFETFATDVMRKESKLDLKTIPSGRCFDMMLFSL